MALFGLAPEVMKPSALVLNILVATIAVVRFYQAGCFSWKRLWPFLIGSVPFAFLGGALNLPGDHYRLIVGIILLIAAFRLALPASASRKQPVEAVPLISGICVGAVIGFLSGLTGTGGGVFLSPILIFAGWAETKTSGGIAAGFILANSVSGLLGRLMSLPLLPSHLPLWAAAAVVGAVAGTTLGTKKMDIQSFRYVLALVLVLAGLKLLLT
jgi:uncharacterized protein